jgi:eukaryotic-like serine/threonine-protein kinase
MATDEIATAKPQSQRIGRYELKARIGRGAMGVVYQAYDGVMCRDVALKVLTADCEDDPEIRTRFLREAQAAAGLVHPNIITIFEFGENNDRFFIAMELLRGTVLKDFLKQSASQSPGRKLHLMMQLCAGVGAAHRASICHRDIKPGNIFVRTDGLLKILDFGVARLASSNMTASGFVVGTPDYMSPEQARGEDIDGRSDIFSMGGVFYFMLTGRKPFVAPSMPMLFHQIQSENPLPIADDAPPELESVVMKALAKTREARYQSCDELLADLQLVARLYPIDPIDTALLDAVAEPPSTVGADAESASTEDTMDFDPRSSTNTADTVSLERRSWTSRVRAGIDAAVSGMAARLSRTSRLAEARDTTTRKR